MPDKKPTSSWKLIRNRIIAGLFVVLPLFITFVVIKWLYELLYSIALEPISRFLLAGWFPDTKDNLPFYIDDVAIPIVALGLVAGLLFITGMFFNSRLHRLMDWFMNSVPGVNMVYSIVSNVFEAVQRSQFGTDEYERVVLVEFPHPGMKCPAFVTSETTDSSTGETILCVYVPTTPVPTSGYMLMVPESNVVPLDWDLQETLQAIVSGGITAPPSVQYYSQSDSNQNSPKTIAPTKPVKDQ